jgi:drug/metabolite transporter (DMT)-like permease
LAAIALGLVAALLWGVSDFLGGVQSRRLPALLVAGAGQASSLVVLALVALLIGSSPPGFAELAPALGAGAAAAIGLGAFYRALAIGTLSIVAPITATGVVIPILVGVLGGDSLIVLQAIGIGAAATGVVLAARAGGAGPPSVARESLLLALLAAGCLGVLFTCVHAAVSAGVLWSLLGLRAVSVCLLAILIVAARTKLEVSRADVPGLLAIGASETGATAAYSMASSRGMLSIVAMLAALYPVTTVVLARFVLGERLQGLQRMGVVLALGGVVAMAAK